MAGMHHVGWNYGKLEDDGSGALQVRGLCKTFLIHAGFREAEAEGRQSCGPYVAQVKWALVCSQLEGGSGGLWGFWSLKYFLGIFLRG